MWPFKPKMIHAPINNEVTSVQGVKLWYVRWTGRVGSYHSDTKECVEAFPVQEDAERFAESLRAAFRLVRHKGAGTNVVVSEQDHAV